MTDKQDHPTNKRLRNLMKHHKLGRRDVARLVGYKIHPNGQAYSVHGWLQNPNTKAYQIMPQRVLDVLELRLKVMTDAERKRLEGPLDKVAVMAANRSKKFERKRKDAA